VTSREFDLSQKLRKVPTMSDAPKHVNSHHADTLRAIFAHPTNHNIHWNDVVSLIGEVGTCEEKHDGKLKVTIGSETEFFIHPKHKDIDTQMIVDLRRMLKNAGYAPQN
jgi:hypothetical protein